MRRRQETGQWDGEIRRLWEQGLIDREISAALYISVSVVCTARKRMGLPPNWRGIRETRPGERLRLYRSGLTDRQIAEAEGLTPGAVTAWRARKGLPPNTCRARDQDRAPDPERYALWKQGLNDRQMAEALGMSASGVYGWRHRHGLGSNSPRGRKKKEVNGNEDC